MNDDDTPPRKTGYKSPPVEHQFKKGQSGNRAGRKPKAARSLLPRQLRNDILRIGQMTTKVRTPTGEEVVSIYEAVILRLSHKALAGHGPSVRQFVQLFQNAVSEHFEDFREYFENVDYLERQRLIKTRPADEDQRFLEFLNELRRKTQKL